MIYTVCVYFDKDLEKYNPPFFVPFDTEQTIENVIDGVKKGKIEHPESFDMYLLGTYDTATALFNLVKEPKKLITLGDYVRETKA